MGGGWVGDFWSAIFFSLATWRAEYFFPPKCSAGYFFSLLISLEDFFSSKKCRVCMTLQKPYISIENNYMKPKPKPCIT